MLAFGDSLTAGYGLDQGLGGHLRQVLVLDPPVAVLAGDPARDGEVERDQLAQLALVGRTDDALEDLAGPSAA